eukprot:10891944-Alexandrium_andersonii.AAC.1
MTHIPHDKWRSSSGAGGSPAAGRAIVEHLLRHVCPGWWVARVACVSKWCVRCLANCLIHLRCHAECHAH